MFRIKEINVVELKKRFDENFYFTLLNVREHQGVEFAKIKDHAHLPTGRQPIRYEEMDKENQWLLCAIPVFDQRKYVNI